VFVRFTGTAAGVPPGLPALVRELDSSVPATLRSLEDNLSFWVWPFQVGAVTSAALEGLAIGLGGSLAMSRLLAKYLYGLSSVDAVAFAGAALVLGGAAVVACWLPARRATRVDPLIALRYE
jgi:hypothetical protein